MDTFECIRTRRSIREYSDREVPKEMYVNVIDAARHAPSAGNLQPWKFIVIDEDKTREKIASACSQQFWMEQAPIHIIICCVVDKPSMMYGPRGEMLYSIQDCAMAVENMSLAANELGLGSCFVGAFVEEDIKSIASIPEGVRVQGILTLGYATHELEKPDKITIDSMVYFDKYGNMKKDLSLFLWNFSDYTANLAKTIGKKIEKKSKPHLEKFKEKIKESFMNR